MSERNLKIASWNVARGLSDTERFLDIADGIKTINADYIVLSESLDQTGQSALPNFAKEFGYNGLTSEYEDEEPHPSKRQFISVLSRIAIDHSVVRLGTRNGIESRLTLQDGTDLRAIGAHFDDRNSQTRNTIATSIADTLDPSERTIVLGDMNSMNGSDRKAKIIGNPLLRTAAEAIPIVGTEFTKTKLARIKSLATRLSDMADPKAQEILDAAGLIDADPTFQATMLLGGRAIAQLDHIRYSSKLNTTNFRTYKLPGSDHKAISLEVIHNY